MKIKGWDSLKYIKNSFNKECNEIVEMFKSGKIWNTRTHKLFPSEIKQIVFVFLFLFGNLKLKKKEILNFLQKQIYFIIISQI